MKSKYLILTATIFLLFTNIAPASADNCSRKTSCTTSSPYWGSTDYCSAGQKSECWYVEGVTIGYVNSCTACTGKRTLKQTAAGMCSTLKYTECVCNNGCNDIKWTAGNTGYEYSVTCGSECNTARQYRCAAGYYGTSTNGTSGCSQCPIWSGVYTNAARTTAARGISSAGTTAATGCYITPGQYYDVTGTFTVGSICPYK